MTRLRGIGFFRELSPGDNLTIPSIHDALGDIAQADEEKIVAYLSRGAGLAGSAGYIRDVLDPAITGLTESIFTDGVYAWRGDLAYYVNKYHVRVPQEFIAHMRSNLWCPPSEDSLDLDNYVIDDS